MSNETVDLLRQIRDLLARDLPRFLSPASLPPGALERPLLALPTPPAALTRALDLASMKREPDERLKKKATEVLDKAAVEKLSQDIHKAAGKIFDALVARKGSAGDFLKGFGLTQLRTIFQNSTVEMLRLLTRVVPQIRDGFFGRVLKGTIFNGAPLEQAARLHVTAATQLSAAAAELAGAARTLAAGGPGVAAGSPFLSQAFGGKLGGLMGGRAPELLAMATGGLGLGKAGPILGAAAAGGLFGAKSAGFGIAGLGKVGGALVGGSITGGIAALMLGFPKLLASRKTPAQRAAEIERILETSRFAAPTALNRQLGFGEEGSGDVDFGFGEAPRLVGNVTVNAMDSRSFMDRAPEIASAVRRAMLDMHPINQLVRETL